MLTKWPSTSLAMAPAMWVSQHRPSPSWLPWMSELSRLSIRAAHMSGPASHVMHLSGRGEGLTRMR